MSATSVIERFRELHRSGCFVMPNPWDAGAAKMFHHLGFQALASTSAGVAFANGLPDRVDAVPLPETLAHLRALVTATPLPVNADFQAGFARDADGVAASVAACVATGVAGLSIEDATGDKAQPLYDRATAIDRLRAARRAIDASGVPVVLTARCEAVLLGAPDGLATVMDRIVAFAEAGADCLFAPAVYDPPAIAAIVKAVAPKPVNVLVARPMPGLTLRELTALGVRRISVGSGLARVAYGAALRAARAIADSGTFDALGDAATFAELNAIFS
jgi:2-methylisocitrate lyase-like PEP mutase family enzyme